ncbi:MAG: hypothetical protein HY731_12290, partial [Candidatus Tectomicrobia bacterium]|nr:hypothetical protein [Candidatus Tectomicrobia bacterium]
MRLNRLLVVAICLMLIGVLATPALAAKFRGKIKSIDLASNSLVIDDQGTDVTLVVNPDAEIKIGKDKKQLSDFKVGNFIEADSEMGQ